MNNNPDGIRDNKGQTKPNQQSSGKSGPGQQQRDQKSSQGQPGSGQKSGQQGYGAGKPGTPGTVRE